MNPRDVRMYGVPAKQIDLIWSDVEPLLKSAIVRSAIDKYQTEDIYKSLLAQDMQLWVAYDKKGLCAIEITQIINYPRQKVLMLVFTAGRDSETWLPFVDVLKQFAESHNCNSLEGFGRPGWEKLSKSFGFKKISTLYKFDL